MHLLNFAHPLTDEQQQQIEQLADRPIDRIIDLPTQIDTGQPLGPQVVALADRAGLSPRDWQTLPLLINPPALNYIAVTLLAELHGRCGYFPACVRLQPVPDSVPPRYEVVEILDLQKMRDEARKRR
jgi:hypothetical protein